MEYTIRAHRLHIRIDLLVQAVEPSLLVCDVRSIPASLQAVRSVQPTRSKQPVFRACRLR